MTEHGVAGRRISVTGAGQGIGLGMARHLVANGADLSIMKWADPEPAPTSSELTYTLYVSNSGPDDATGVIATVVGGPSPSLTSSVTAASLAG